MLCGDLAASPAGTGFESFAWTLVGAFDCVVGTGLGMKLFVRNEGALTRFSESLLSDGGLGWDGGSSDSAPVTVHGVCFFRVLCIDLNLLNSRNG